MCRLLVALTVMLAAQTAAAAVKTYTADADQSTVYPSGIDKRIYRGDCDSNAPTGNAGDNFDDQCTCTPGVNCQIGSVPNIECGGSEGRPSGGACDPAIPSGPGSCPPDFPTRGSDDPPCNKTDGGVIVINDTGNGTPTLQTLRLEASWDDIVGGTSTSGIPGATMQIHEETTVTAGSNQTGTGSTTTSINWGTLTGWSQTGTVLCVTHCPPPGCFSASACKGLYSFEGLGPPFHLSATSFNTDPWTFSVDGREFKSDSFEIVSLGFGLWRSELQLGGRQIQVPALPLAALAGLGAGIVYLGARALRR
jgi:hypothetical protein